MTCAPILLAATLAGLPPETCTLQCALCGDLVAVEGDGSTGIATVERGIWERVYRVDREWRIVLEQEPQQCERRL
jgi:coenzyme F420-reducing hydrogenase beta subunit